MSVAPHSQRPPLALLDAEGLYAQLRDALQSWQGSRTQWVGITSGGAWIVKRLQQDWGLEAVGTISSNLHRDDFHRRKGKVGHSCAGTHLPFDVAGADVVLIDDVLFTGRTIRAVLNELFDFGRPASVRLAVLVDRGERQLPIHADYAAQHLHLGLKEKLALTKDARGAFVFATESMEPL